MARETIHCSLDDRLQVDEQIAGDLVGFEEMSDLDATGRARALADALDPSSAVARRRHAEADRHVSLRPAPDTMTWLTALLPVTDGVACQAALDQAADTARAAGDPRSRGQVQADALTQRLTTAASPSRGADAVGAAATGETDLIAGNHQPDVPVPGGTGCGVGVAVELVVSDASLLGDSDEPAWLGGYGPIPAELARELVRDSASGEADASASLRRLYADSGGQLVAMDSHARRFPPGLARMIRLRDQICRTPWCDAPIRHIDHALPHADGGGTSYANGQGLCEACNYAKQAAGWQTIIDQAVSYLTTRTGHRYRSQPPPAPPPATPAHHLDIHWSPAA